MVKWLKRFQREEEEAPAPATEPTAPALKPVVQAAKPRVAPPRRRGQVTVREAAVTVLSRAQKPALDASTLIDRILRVPGVQVSSRKSVVARLSDEARQGELLERPWPGVYRLRPGARARLREQAEAQPVSPRAAAIEILRAARRPLPAHELIDRVLAHPQVQIGARRPRRIVEARLTEMRRRGEVRRPAPGVYELVRSDGKI